MDGSVQFADPGQVFGRSCPWEGGPGDGFYEAGLPVAGDQHDCDGQWHSRTKARNFFADCCSACWQRLDNEINLRRPLVTKSSDSHLVAVGARKCPPESRGSC